MNPLRVACWSLGVVLLSVPATGTAEDIPDFRTQIMPVLTKAGCNSAACHGASIGRGGLRLSLLGYDPDADFERLVFEYQSRRANLSRPEKSLMLLKPSRQVKHKGGKKLPADSEGYRLVHRWLQAGAPRKSHRQLESLAVQPRQQLLNKSGDSFQLKVIANFDDGTTRDVTEWAVFEPNDKEAVRAGKDGKITALARGQSSVMIRFLGQVKSVIVTVPLADKPLDLSELAANNYVDDHIFRSLTRIRMQVSPPADPNTYVRRIYLDLIGRLPSPQEIAAFLAKDDSDRHRDQLIDELMQRKEFVDHWSYKWGDLLQIESRRLGQAGAASFHRWVRNHVSRNTPLNKMAEELLLAEGDSFKRGAANFHRVPQDPLKQAEYVSKVFLGVRLQCANCHNHPLDQWTQDDYHGLAAIFSRIRRDQVVKWIDRGEVIHPKSGKAALPRIPGERFLNGSGKSIQELAEWLTHADNPYFARAAVNRLWRELMGRGLVEPVDDHRASNPATHPELLDALAKDFVEHDFNVRHIIKTIVSSAAYQRSSLTHGNNHLDNRFYGHAIVRPLPPTVMVDAVSSVTGVAESLGATPAGTTANSLGDSRILSQPLDLLGRCDRNMDCAPVESGGTTSLPLTLHIINGNWINTKIENKNGRLYRLLKKQLTNEEIVTQFYQMAYGRDPSAKELAHWEKILPTEHGDHRVSVFKDFLWAILNSNEFCSNH